MGLQWLHAWGMMVTMVTCMGNDGYKGYMHGVGDGYNILM